MRIVRCTMVSLSVLLAGSLRAEEKPKDKPAEAPKPVSVAHIKISGSLDESPTAADPFLGTTPENFKSRLDRIKKAKKDDKIKALVLEVDEAALGWGKIDELRRAIANFRSSGKKTFAYLEGADSKSLAVALACDQVVMPESGMILLTGLRAEITLYKKMLDRIGVQADFIQMGDFKGGPEPFTRETLSEANKRQITEMLDDFYDHSLVGAIVASRPQKKWTTEQVKKIIDEGPFTAKKAKELGLIDALAYPDEFKSLLARAVSAEAVQIVRDYGKAKPKQLNFANPFAVFGELFSQPSERRSDKPKIAVIYAVGAITSGKSGDSLFMGGTVGSETMVEAIRQAEKDATVKAIVLRVDSPGGSSLASDLIWHELRKSSKPVVASMGDVAASGGYYIAMAAQKIYAEPSTITGSIGVFGGKLVTGGMWKKLETNTEIIARGKNSGVFSSEQPFTESERAAMLAILKDIYDQFIDKALEGRKKAGVKMTRKELLSLAGGRVWTGRQAKAKGLVDELGTLNDAIAGAKKLAGVDPDADMELLILPKPKSFLDRLLESQGVETALSRSGGATLRSLPEVTQTLKAAELLLRFRDQRVWLMAPYQIEIK